MIARRISVGLFAVVLAITAPTRTPASPKATNWRALADPIFRVIAQDNDLPNGALPQALGQDADGFVWIGTQNGLARWDGAQFRIYRADPDRTGALPDNVVLALHRDAAGRLWVGTEGGLARYDPTADRFLTVAPEAGSTGETTSIADDGAGGIWAGTASGLLRVAEDGRVLARWRHDAKSAASLPDDRVSAVLRDRSGVLWVGGAGGLARLRHGSFDPVLLDGKADPAAVLCLAQDGAGLIWAGTSDRGAFVIDRAGTTRPVPAALGSGGGPADPVVSAAEIGPGEVWLGTQGGGLLEVDAASLASTRVRHEPTLSTSLLDGAVRAILRDRSGLVWIATIHGVARFDPAQRAVVTVFGDHGRPAGLATSDVLSVLAAPDGRVWAASRHDGIDILDPAHRQVAALRPGTGPPDTALPALNVVGLAAMPDGTVLIGSAAGLYRADAAGRGVQRVPVPGRDTTLPVEALRRLGDVVWLGGPDGVWAVRQAPGGLRVLRHVGADALDRGRPRGWAAGPSGTTWLATSHGLFLLPAGGGAPERIVPIAGDPASLSSSHVMTVLTDGAGRLWAGTMDRGLNLMVGRNAAGRPVFRRFGMAQGVPNDSIDALILAADGAIWASTDGGLMRIDPATLAVRAYGLPDGVAIAGYYTGAASRLEATGELLFGGMGGLTIVRPLELSHERPAGRVLPTETRIGGKPVWARADGAAPLLVPAAANAVSVQFAAPETATPEMLRYAYRLDGFDPDWIEVDATRRTAAYTNLPPGDYTLHLRAATRDGAWSPTGTLLRIRVLAAWYQTLWFRLLAAIAAGLAVLGMVQGRTAFMRRRAAQLERQVAERTAELVQAQSKLRDAAYGDLLTGLPNRRAFNEQFHALLGGAERASHGFVLLLIDLDGFKQVNDTRGHDVGDAVLSAAARRLRERMRDCDMVARLGGDEFAVLLADQPPPAWVDQVCARLIAALSMPIQIHGVMARIGASVGVAAYPEHGASQELLYKSADLALYDAKHAGRGTARWFRVTVEEARASLIPGGTSPIMFDGGSGEIGAVPPALMPI